jgi:hypothetical protein
MGKPKAQGCQDKGKGKAVPEKAASAVPRSILKRPETIAAEKAAVRKRWETRTTRHEYAAAQLGPSGREKGHGGGGGTGATSSSTERLIIGEGDKKVVW